MKRSGLQLADFGLLAGVLALRAAFLLSTWNDPVFRVPYLDSAFYDTWARSLAAGHGDFQGPYFLGPLYPYFLAVVYRLTGPDVHAVRVLQSLFGVLSAGLLLGLGKRLCGALAARTAVVLLALFGPLVFYENLLVMESLLLGLTFGALWTLCVPSWRSEWRAASTGALLGLASLGRPTVLLAAPIVAWALLRGTGARTPDRAKSKPRDRGARAYRPVAVAAAAWIAILLPVVLRNVHRGGGPVVATNGGINFYAGNQAGANGRFRTPQGVQFFAAPVTEMDLPAGTSERANLPSAVARRPLTVLAVAGTPAAADSRLWMRRAWQWMKSDPGAAAALPFRKAWLVLQAREVPQLESYAFHAKRLRFLHLFGVDFGLLWTLAALGLYRARRIRMPHRGLLVGYGIAMLMPCLLFFVTGRYRLAALPYAALFAGLGVATLLEWLRARAWRSAGLAVLALLPLAVATRLGAAPPQSAAGWEAAQMAERLYTLGDLGQAIAWQEQAAALLPSRFEPQLDLALYWSERRAPRDRERAERLVASLVERWPQEPTVWFNWGVLLADLGRIDEARAAWKRTLALDPRFEAAHARLLQTEIRP